MKFPPASWSGLSHTRIEMGVYASTSFDVLCRLRATAVPVA
jgi:hypothetical protein